MTLADIRRALDVIDAAIPKLQAGAAELDRRAGDAEMADRLARLTYTPRRSSRR